jgi:hypothetical protein
MFEESDPMQRYVNATVPKPTPSESQFSNQTQAFSKMTVASRGVLLSEFELRDLSSRNR